MSGTIPPLYQYAFMAWCLVKHRDNFTFTLHSVSDMRNTNLISRLLVTPLSLC